jgi:SAM-dependent methyltransferase
MRLTQKIKAFLFYTPLNPYFLAKLNLLLAMKYAAKYTKGVTVDIGCGKKPYYKYFQEKTTSYFGLDYPDYSIDTTWRMDVISDAQLLPIKDCSADTVVCNQVLEHIPDTHEFFRNVRRVLRSEGILILTVPFFWGLHEEPRDYYRFTKYGLLYLCEANGLDVVDIKKLGGIWGTIFQRISDYVVQPLRALNKNLFVVALPLTFILQSSGFLLDLIFLKTGDNLDWLLIARKR